MAWKARAGINSLAEPCRCERSESDGARAVSITFDAEPTPVAEIATTAVPDGCEAVTSPVTGSVWKQSVVLVQQIAAGQELLIIEAKKMEIPIVADAAGEVVELRCEAGRAVAAGDVLVVVKASNGTT